jgi:mRNA interferase RelE/StbE
LIPSKGSFELRFTKKALREWEKLDKSSRNPMLKRLNTRLGNPRVEKDRLSSDLKNYYKIKDNKTGYRLVYFVSEIDRAVTVMAVGTRENSKVYTDARKRIKELGEEFG